jgi:hypothetical protein
MKTVLFQKSGDLVTLITIIFFYIILLFQNKQLIVGIYIFVILSLSIMYRFPNRNIIRDNKSIYSPSDGKIMKISEDNTNYHIFIISRRTYSICTI